MDPIKAGWPDGWEVGHGWELNENACRWCPLGDYSCGRHHQSPIDLQRNVAMNNSEIYPLNKTCIDVHWMKYEDSSCRWDILRELQAFDIERHALTIRQPIEPIDPDDEEWNFVDKTNIGYHLQCFEEGRGRIWGRIDFSKGFSHWWYLSHTDIKVPSEHTQNDQRYDAEVQLHHFYSVESGILVDPEKGDYNENEMATVSIFLQAYPEAPPYHHLDRVICEWRAKEERIRQACGISTSAPPYPGCFNPLRGYTPFPTESPNSKTNSKVTTIKHNERRRTTRIKTGTAQSKASRILLSKQDYRPEEKTEEEWEDFIQDYRQKYSSQDIDRNLLGYKYLSFHNYQWMIDVRTEYYFRYQGTSTIPPCYGEYERNSRKETNHWRVMKDPIRVHPRQIAELQRLLKERVDPETCKEGDTAAVVNNDDGTVSVARPLQQIVPQHFKTFCECQGKLFRNSCFDSIHA